MWVTCVLTVVSLMYEPFADLCVGEAVGDEAQDFMLSFSEFVEFFWRRWDVGVGTNLLDHVFGDRR